MGIRETLNQNPAITTGVTIGIIVLALVFIGYQLLGDSGPRVYTLAWYTTDDSSPEAALAAMFEDDINKLAPFDKNGKPAYRVYVYTCDDGKTKFVSHLERYTDDAKKRLEQLRAPGGAESADPAMFESVMMNGVEVKDPGTGPWVQQANYEAAQKIMTPTCPDGSMNNIQAVFPED